MSVFFEWTGNIESKIENQAVLIPIESLNSGLDPDLVEASLS